jgi:hypothetical protein
MDPASKNEVVLRYNICWRTESCIKIIRASREKYYYYNLECPATLTYRKDRLINRCCQDV